MREFFRLTRLYIIVIPLLIIVFGAALNQCVLIANYDTFPVMENGVKAAADKVDKYGFIDDTHVLMTKQTHLNWLGDIFDFHAAIVSIGDLIGYSGYWLWDYAPFVWGVMLLYDKLGGR